MKHRLIAVGSDDGPAGPGELGAGANLTGHVDHLHLSLGKLVDRATHLEVLVDELTELVVIAGKQRFPGPGRQRRTASHCPYHRRLAPVEAIADVVVKDFRWLSFLCAVGEID